MSGSDYLQPLQFFRGGTTSYPVGHMLDPSEPHDSMYAISDPGSAYFTADRNNAIRYAKDKAASSGKMEHAADWSSVHVHQVEPTGHYEKDNLDPRQSFKTKHPLRVVGKVYLPGQPRD